MCPTGLIDLDWMIGDGLHPQNMIILAARPSMGKSALAMNFARHIALNEGKAVAYFSLELERNNFLPRMLSAMAEINPLRIRHPHLLTKKEWASLPESVQVIDQGPLYLDFTQVMKPQEVCKRVSELSSKKASGS